MSLGFRGTIGRAPVAADTGGLEDGQSHWVEFDTLEDGTPSQSEHVVYVQSHIDVAQSGVAQPVVGGTTETARARADNANASKGRATTTITFEGASVSVPTEPFLTLAKARSVWGVHATNGAKIKYRVMGGRVSDQRLGWWAPDTKRYYLQDDLISFGGGAYDPTESFWGPHAMLPVNPTLGALDCVALANVGRDGLFGTQWTFSQNLGAWDAATNQWGRAGFLRVTRISDGVEVTAPIQIGCQLGTDRLITDNGGNAGGGMYLANGTQRCAIVGPAAEFVNGPGFRGAPTASPDGTWFHGTGTFELGARTTEKNPYAKYNRITFERAKFSEAGGSFDLCLFYGAPTEFRGGWNRLRGCLVIGDLVWLCGGRRIPPEIGAVDELRSYARDYQGAPYAHGTGDPFFPHRGPVELQVMHGSIVIGRGDGDGQFLLDQAMSVRAVPGTVGISVVGNGSRLTMGTTGFLNVKPSNNVTPLLCGIYAGSGGHVVANDSTFGGLVEINATTHLRCGSLVAQLGAGVGGLREVAGHAGNMFQNGSRIRDVAAEP